MTVQCISPASVYDIAEVMAISTRLHWWIAKEMLSGGISWAFVKNGETIGVLGIYADADNLGEAWFDIKPSAQSSMLSICRASRLTLPKTPYREVYTICTSEAGKRIAAMMGFKYLSQHEFGEKWIWETF
ncbi:MAG: hypothetical protein U5K75_08600 [Ahrensia sp.]|nr:hypothetical protein [Ahrensia sp.]